MKYRYLFGPVPSRRLGISLGIDLLPGKTCPLNCIYCECGDTTDLTVECGEYVPTGEVLEELQSLLVTSPALNHITFSGSGEPTLHDRLGHIIDFIKERFPRYRVAVLTNGTLLPSPEVRLHLRRADRVIPSLDASSEEVFQRLNRPHPLLSCPEHIAGLQQFRQEYSGEFFLEIFLVSGVNDTEEEIEGMRRALQEIRPDRIQLNTLDRPAIHPVKELKKKQLEKIAAFLGAEVVGRFDSEEMIPGFLDGFQDILAVLQRRPCTARDLAAILQLTPLEIGKALRFLQAEGKVERREGERGVFFQFKKTRKGG